MIEKHFTVDKNLKKSADHWLSVNPKELNQIRIGVDELMEAYGNGVKKFSNLKKIQENLQGEVLLQNL